MTLPLAYSGPSKRTAEGFVLVAVLLLIALVTILVATTSLLSQIERRATDNSARSETARQNAIFGLNVALAQLQKQAGPDQAITARADILDSDPTTTKADGLATSSQAYWTGIWKTGNAPLDAAYTATLPAPSTATAQRTTSLGNTSPSSTQTTIPQKVASAKWLVSDPIDPGTSQPLVLDPTTALPASIKTVAVAKNLPDLLGGASLVSVNAPLVSVYPSAATASPTATPAGKYAFWVSDEGVKAKPTLVDPTYGTSTTGNSSFVQNQLHFALPQGIAAQNGLLGTANATDIRDPKYATDLPKVGTLQSLGYVQGTASTPAVTGFSGVNAARFSPDVTTVSYGVLADVRNGGLKTDLSQLFEDPTNQFGSFLNAQAAVHTVDSAADQKVWEIVAGSYDSGNVDTDPCEFGVRWQSLFNYYSLYKNSTTYPGTAPWKNLDQYSSGNPGTASPSIDTRVFNYTSNYTGSAGGPTATEMGESYLPHVLGFGITFSMSSMQLAPTGSNPHNYSLVMYAEPQLILYNPYNVTLTSSTPYTVALNTNVLGHGWVVSVNGTPVMSQNPTWTGGTGTSAGYADVTLQTLASDNLTLKPGEIRVYGLGTLSTQQPLGKCVVFSGLTDKVGQSQWQYIGDTSTSPTTPSTTSQWQANEPDTAHVTVSFNSGNLWSNDGRYKVSGGAGYWPVTAVGSNELGRFFSSPPNEPTQSADLGAISSMASATANPSSAITFGYFEVRAKGLTQKQTSNASTIQALPTFCSADGAFNPLATFFDNTMFDTDFQMAVQNPSSLSEMQVAGGPNPPFNSFWGTQDTALSAGDPTYVVLRDVPRQPMVSLGQFMHMPMRTSTRMNDKEIDTNSCLMGVGGSLSDPYFPVTSVWGNNNNGGVASFDDNFLMNQALFDTYYLSTVPPSSGTMDTAYGAVLPAMKNGTTAFNDANVANGTCVLPNARMNYYRKNGISPQTSTSAAANYLPNYQKSAANLLLNGAFNVNSTSIPAWRALLSSLSGTANAASYLTPTGSSSLSTMNFSSSQYPIFRFLSPALVNGSTLTTSSAPNPWASINVLTESTGGVTQVTALATAIVKQVKTRGPFLSMADFLNRRLTTCGLGSSGALQAAIDDAATSGNTVNANLVGFGTATGNGTKGGRGSAPTADSTRLPNNTAIGVPGWLMQQDLVQCFSPVMTVRSDTFVVRCYGEADNARTGITEARAWGEAVVQRLPDFVDQTDPALTTGSSPLGDATPISRVSSTNQVLGRRFQVVSFRWLNETDL